ncbi:MULTISPECIES: hypothetical protein [unclassified Rathayibacter]|uniref:hypothetical protein n=1 Tax=unclassified Rathayibacter TaxID=2609250 RepID=UPI002B27AAA8|nr:MULTISPECIES: hypothetical protein [unclassified Rathayibacter]
MTPPPRRLPAGVYRRRRAVLLLVVLAVVAIVVVLVLRPWTGVGTPDAGAPTPTESPLPTLYPSASDSGTPAAIPPCTAASVSVTAVTDATSYGAGVNPQLSLSLANISNADCVMNAGTSQQVFRITSGSDQIWSSADCQTGATDLRVLLQAGRSVTGSSITWDRTRSSPDTCSGGREAVTAGGAAYNLSVSVGGIESGSTTQFLLE